MAQGKINKTCVQTGEHDWSATAADGWFRCERYGCSAYATCPACLGVRVVDTQTHFCVAHLAYAPLVDTYPVAEPVPAEPAEVVEQHALW